MWSSFDASRRFCSSRAAPPPKFPPMPSPITLTIAIVPAPQSTQVPSSTTTTTSSSVVTNIMSSSNSPTTSSVTPQQVRRTPPLLWQTSQLIFRPKPPKHNISSSFETVTPSFSPEVQVTTPAQGLPLSSSKSVRQPPLGGSTNHSSATATLHRY